MGVDEWEAMCRNRISCSFTVLAEPNETMITFVSCRELLATSKMLLHRAGSKSKATGWSSEASAANGPVREVSRDCGPSI